MPLDATATTVLPVDSPERWSHVPNRIKEPRQGFQPVDDDFALYLVLLGVKNAWAKRLNDDLYNHCIVGWVTTLCEANTVFNRHNPSDQSKRILKRLHDALPKSARRVLSSHADTLAKYNDTHSHKAVVRVAESAYQMYINEIRSALQ